MVFEVYVAPVVGIFGSYGFVYVAQYVVPVVSIVERRQSINRMVARGLINEIPITGRTSRRRNENEVRVAKQRNHNRPHHHPPLVGWFQH